MSVEHWEGYYRGGALASCPMGPQAGYTLELRDAWLGFFGRLPEGSRVLDIGTGNGAVALIAKEAGRRLEIHGTDLARIDPIRDVTGGAALFRGITFHPGVATERLPFPDGHFAGVSGQYALEYSPPQALAEIRRVLAPAGEAQFVLHHADSVIVANAGQSQAETRLILEDTRLFRRLRRWIEADIELARPNPRPGRDLQAALSQLQQAAAGRRTPTLAVALDSARRIVATRGQLPQSERLRLVERAEREIRLGARRLADLLAVARGEDDMASLRAFAATVGLHTVDLDVQRHAGDHVVGWRWLLARD